MEGIKSQERGIRKQENEEAGTRNQPTSDGKQGKRSLEWEGSDGCLTSSTGTQARRLVASFERKKEDLGKCWPALEKGRSREVLKQMHAARAHEAGAGGRQARGGNDKITFGGLGRWRGSLEPWAKHEFREAQGWNRGGSCSCQMRKQFLLSGGCSLRSYEPGYPCTVILGLTKRGGRAPGTSSHHQDMALEGSVEVS
jgi:hypothetical protein